MYWLRLILLNLVGLTGGIQMVEADYNDADLWIEKGQVVFQDKEYQYGSVKRSSDNHYDAYLRIRSENNAEWTTLAYDRGDSESIRYVAIMGEDRILLVMEHYDHSQGGMVPGYLATTLVLCDDEGKIIQTRILEDRSLNWVNLGYRLILQQGDTYHYYDATLSEIAGAVEDIQTTEPFYYQYQGEAMINQRPVETIALTSPGIYHIIIQEKSVVQSFIVRLDALIDGITDHDETQEPIVIDAQGNLFLNDEPYLPETPITIPGHYRLRVEGEGEYQKELTFTLHATIDNVAEGMLVEGPLRIYANGTGIWLNGQPYKNQALTEAGTYQCQVTGVGGYQKSLEFHIIPEVMGVESEETYENPCEFLLNGEGELNGEPVSGRVVVTEPGDYELRLICAGQVYETIQFSLTNPKTNPEGKTLYPIAAILFGLMAILGLVLLLKKR